MIVFWKYNFKIDKYDVNDQFQLKYNFCVTKEECYQSYEYIKPTITSKYDVTLMYLNGEIVWMKTPWLRL